MSYELISESTPVARKQHECVWCGEVIHEGERYRREFCKYEGECNDNAWHLECDDAASHWMSFGDGGFDYEFTPRAQERGQWPDE